MKKMDSRNNPRNNPRDNSQDNSKNVNRNHKDSVFTFLFSNPDILMELYSAIEGITLPPDIPININTLSDVLFRTQRNDISFLINGEENYPDYNELRLSGAFIKTDKIKIDLPLELVVQVYNINKGRNQGILSKSRTLDNYSSFIDKIREYQKEYKRKYYDNEKILEKAFKSAINYCIKNNILRDFLKRHGSEVINMLYAEYDPEVEMRVVREEALEEGMEKSRQHFLELLDQDLTKEEIKERIKHFGGEYVDGRICP